MVLHFAPYPLPHSIESHQPRNKGNFATLPRLSTSNSMTPKSTARSPGAVPDICGNGHRFSGKPDADCILRHTTRITSPDNIGVTPALQRAREEELKARKPSPLITLPSFRESFPPLLSEHEQTPTCASDIYHEKFKFKAAQFPSATQAPFATPYTKVKPYTYKSRDAFPQHAETINRSYENLAYEPARDVDAHSLPPSSDDDTNSVSSSSGLDSNAEANYSPMARPTTEYRYPPLLPELRPQQRLYQITPQYSHTWNNHSAPPGGSTSNVSDSRRVQGMNTMRGHLDRPQQAPPRLVGNDVLTWLEYAEEVQDETGTIHYQCRWERGGRLPTACDYRAQKQAMKRHIEATHLKYKPHKCSFCPKAYSQKTALEVHEAIHTGTTPHECHYRCGKAFNDPARRYRHHVDVHGYIPRQTNKKHGNAQMRVVRDRVRYGTST